MIISHVDEAANGAIYVQQQEVGDSGPAVVW